MHTCTCGCQVLKLFIILLCDFIILVWNSGKLGVALGPVKLGVVLRIRETCYIGIALGIRETGCGFGEAGCGLGEAGRGLGT